MTHDVERLDSRIPARGRRSMRIFRTVSFLAMAGFAAVLGAQALKLPESARTYPEVFIVAVLAGTLAAALRSALSRQGKSMPAEIRRLAALPSTARWRLVGFVALWVAYPWCLSQIGFILATTIGLTLSLLLLDVRRVFVTIAAAFCFSVCLAILFSTVFYIPTPAGYLDEILSHMIFTMTQQHG